MPRLATPDDAAVVARLLIDFNTEFDTAVPELDVLITRVRALLAGDATLALLDGDPPAALALLTLRPNVWYAGSIALLDELYVAPALRSQGIGTRLLAAAERAVRNRGAQVVEINVDGEDAGARRFYERHGYTNTEPGQAEPMLYYYRELT